MEYERWIIKVTLLMNNVSSIFNSIFLHIIIQTSAKKGVIRIQTNIKRRCHHEIISNILSSAQQPRKLSDIVFDSRTNFKQANKYLEKLMKYGLIKKSVDINGFEATEKGIQYLKTYKRLKELLN